MSKKTKFEWKNPYILIPFIAVLGTAIVTIANYINLPMITKALAEEQKEAVKRIDAIERYIEVNQAVAEAQAKANDLMQQIITKDKEADEPDRPKEIIVSPDGKRWYWHIEKQEWRSIKELKESNDN